MRNKIKSFFMSMVCSRDKNVNSKVICGLIGFIILCIGLFVGVDEKLYYIFAMCDVFYFGGSVIDNWTAPKITIDKKETSTKETKTEIDVGKMTDKITKVIKKKK